MYRKLIENSQNMRPYNRLQNPSMSSEVTRAYDVPIISQSFLDTICKPRCDNHHGYVLRKDTLIVRCGAYEAHREKQYHLNLVTGVAEHQIDEHKINVPPHTIDSIRAIQRQLPTFDELSVERCDDHCAYSGCKRGGPIICKVVTHKMWCDPPSQKHEAGNANDTPCQACRGSETVYFGSDSDDEGQVCPCTW